jgi:hypothetical protein
VKKYEQKRNEKISSKNGREQEKIKKEGASERGDKIQNRCSFYIASLCIIWG